MSTNNNSRMTPAELQSFGEKLDAMQSAYDAATRKGLNRPIEFEGRSFGNSELKAKLQSMRETLAVEVAHIRRDKQAQDAQQIENYVDDDGKVKQRSRLRANTPAVDGNAGLVELFGERKYAALTSDQKAAALALVQTDLDVDPALYFGKGSSSTKAQQLAQSNPARYRLLRAKAIELGIF